MFNGVLKIVKQRTFSYRLPIFGMKNFWSIDE